MTNNPNIPELPLKIRRYYPPLVPKQEYSKKEARLIEEAFDIALEMTSNGTLLNSYPYDEIVRRARREFKTDVVEANFREIEP